VKGKREKKFPSQKEEAEDNKRDKKSFSQHVPFNFSDSL